MYTFNIYKKCIHFLRLINEDIAIYSITNIYK